MTAQDDHQEHEKVVHIHDDIHVDQSEPLWDEEEGNWGLGGVTPASEVGMPRIKHPLILIWELGEGHFNFTDEQIIFTEAMVKLLFNNNHTEYVVYIGEDNHR